MLLPPQSLKLSDRWQLGSAPAHLWPLTGIEEFADMGQVWLMLLYQPKEGNFEVFMTFHLYIDGKGSTCACHQMKSGSREYVMWILRATVDWTVEFQAMATRWCHQTSTHTRVSVQEQESVWPVRAQFRVTNVCIHHSDIHCDGCKKGKRVRKVSFPQTSAALMHPVDTPDWKHHNAFERSGFLLFLNKHPFINVNPIWIRGALNHLLLKHEGEFLEHSEFPPYS